MGDIFYSRQNADGTFQEKRLTPSGSHFVICGPCGDLTTFTGSFGAGGGSNDLDGGSPSSIYGGITEIDGGTP